MRVIDFALKWAPCDPDQREQFACDLNSLVKHLTLTPAERAFTDPKRRRQLRRLINRREHV